MAGTGNLRPGNRLRGQAAMMQSMSEWVSEQDAVVASRSSKLPKSLLIGTICAPSLMAVVGRYVQWAGKAGRRMPRLLCY